MPVSDFLPMRENDVKIPCPNSGRSIALKEAAGVKSQNEIAAFAKACKYQSEAMDNMPNILCAGMTEKDACRLGRMA